MNFGLSNRVIDKLNDILINNPLVDKAVIFGSRAIGDFKEGSDIDLALFGELTLRDIFKIKIMIEDSNIPQNVDLINYNKIKNPELKDEIDKYGIDFFVRNMQFAELTID